MSMLGEILAVYRKENAKVEGCLDLKGKPSLAKCHVGFCLSHGLDMFRNLKVICFFFTKRALKSFGVMSKAKFKIVFSIYMQNLKVRHLPKP